MHRRPLTIGIAGGTGSGKTTLSHVLAQGLDGYTVKVIHMDKYYHERRPVTAAAFSGKTYEDYNDPLAVNIDRVLEDLQHADTGEDVVIVEGFLAFHYPQLRERMDYKVYMDCQSDERLARRLGKFSGERYSAEEVVREYLDLVRYRHDLYVEPTRWYADLVLNGSWKEQKGSRMLLEWIQYKLARSSGAWLT
ncbi:MULTISPECIES: uridine kinase family protein [Paenibacillus]|uniref:uridine kinase family protein n=1 Tax=Paenibacillus TaxID=44249 RepID=UPI0022B8F0E4|nr:AAA family ATPase [Paenibacillus caseinilyticus]MCZ8520312.1 AAA family ATPase [Paenibacillus caseinilyticus]